MSKYKLKGSLRQRDLRRRAAKPRAFAPNGRDFRSCGMAGEAYLVRHVSGALFHVTQDASGAFQTLESGELAAAAARFMASA